ncbi:hypothetical protein [Modestobacter altitudinis]|nr:hypothetical protein [Modestobacter altitudinis]
MSPPSQNRSADERAVVHLSLDDLLTALLPGARPASDRATS